jgi:hypothetical protein
MSIHHIYVNAAGSGLLCLSDLFTQPSEVGSEDRWSQLNPVFYRFRFIRFYFNERRFEEVVRRARALQDWRGQNFVVGSHFDPFRRLFELWIARLIIADAKRRVRAQPL